MPLGLQIVRKEKGESSLDKILKGVSLANSIVGTVGGVVELKDRMDARGLAKQSAADSQGGVYTQKELDTGGFVEAKDGEAGAIARKLRQGADVRDVFVKKYEKPDAGKSLSLEEKNKLIAETRKLNADANKANRGDGDPGSKEFKTNQYAAAGFANRAVGAEAALGKLMDPETGFNATDWRPLDRFRPETKIPQNVKMYNQIKNDFVSAVLRKESGAAIGEDERAAEERKYFPQPGDGQDVLDRKSESRSNAVAALKAEAGGALDQVMGQRGLMGLVGSEKRNQYKTYTGEGEQKKTATVAPDKLAKAVQSFGSQEAVQKAAQQKLREMERINARSR